MTRQVEGVSFAFLFPASPSVLVTVFIPAGRPAGTISAPINTLMVVMVLVTTLITPVLLRLVYPWESPVTSSSTEIAPEADTTG